MYLAHQAVHDPLGLPPAEYFSAEQLDLLERIETGSEEGTGTLRARFAKVTKMRQHSCRIAEFPPYHECVRLALLEPPFD